MSNFIVHKQTYTTHNVTNVRTSLKDWYKFKLYEPFVKSTNTRKKMVFKEFYLWQNDSALATKWKRDFYFIKAQPAYPFFQVGSKGVSGPIANKLGQDPAVLVVDPNQIKEGVTEYLYMHIEDPNSDILPTSAPMVAYGDLSYTFRIVVDYYY